ncbi:MAG: T9SS type A sorting domain-containing protein, partial [Bacteroidetes bacterium]|nr:T9SS type A sorting domain-containing protein [Bacteroidota bacterium]MBU1578235.1 T9SS type A sorting domain-containing protein [Bacteroidota bacterium]
LITGYHTGVIQLDGIQLNSISEQSLFFARLDPDGNTLMAKNHGNSAYLETGTVIDTDENNNIYIIGTTDGNISFLSTSLILKYDHEGNLLYSEYSQENYMDMKVKGQNIYFAGTVNEEGYIGDFFLDPVWHSDAFIAKANLDLEYNWVVMANHGETGGDSHAVAMDVDDQENIYITGENRVNIGFGEAILSPHNGSFVLRADENGEISWLSGFSEIYHSPKTLSIGGSNNLLVITRDNIITFYLLDGFMQNEIGIDQDFENCIFNTQTNEFINIGSDSQKVCMHAFDTNLNTQWNIQYEGDAASSYVINARGDKYGNTYSLNSTSNTIEYQGTEIENGLFFVKQNSAGEILWLHNFPDVFMMPEYGSFLEIDTVNGFVYIIGYFEESFIVPGIETLVAGEDGSIFILKYNFEGSFQWASQMDFDPWGLSLATSATGNLFISGSFDGTVTIGDETLTSLGETDFFISRINSDGTFSWATGVGGAHDIDYFCTIAANDVDEVYFAGEILSSEVFFENYQLTLNQGDGNIVFAKFDGNGNLQWATSKAGSLKYEGWGDDYCWPTGLETDTDGNVFMKGWHGDSTYFDNVMLRSPYYALSKFIAKFNPEGNTIWAKSINETRVGMDYNQMSTDEAGNAYVGISVRDTIYFEDIYMYPCSESNDLLVAKYNPDGMLEWAKFIQGQRTFGYAPSITSVSALSNDYVLCTGYFTGMLEFGEESLNADNYHGFMVSIGQITGILENDGVKNIPLIRVYPNPSDNLVNIILPSYCKFDVSLKDNTGRTVVEKTSNIGDQHLMDVSTLPGGIYYLIIEAEDSTEIIKLILE